MSPELVTFHDGGPGIGPYLAIRGEQVQITASSVQDLLLGAAQWLARQDLTGKGPGPSLVHLAAGEGFRDARRGVPRRNNPYPPDTISWWQWRCGWEEGRSP